MAWGPLTHRAGSALLELTQAGIGRNLEEIRKNRCTKKRHTKPGFPMTILSGDESSSEREIEKKKNH